MKDLQETRLKYCLGLFAEACLKHYDSNGNYIGSSPPPDNRDLMRSAAALLKHGGKKEANLAEKLIMQVFRSSDGVDYTLLPLEQNLVDARKAITLDWNMFHSNDASYILAVHGRKVSGEVRKKLERIARRNFSRFAGSAQPDYFFHGYNDNMPAHAASGLILGGEALDNRQAVKDGVYRLELFAEILSRRGKASEYSSGNYLPLTISGIAKIAEYSKDRAIRSLARQVEEQLWADVVLHHHVATARNAAAQSRAYTWNTVGHVDTLSCALWLAGGFPPSYCPFDYAMKPLENQVCHFDGDAWKSVSDIISMFTIFHLPGYLMKAISERSYPYQFKSSSETGGENGGEIFSTSWHRKEYALASSTGGYSTEKQSEVFYAVYSRKKKARNFTETGCVYSRFLINDDEPGQATDFAGGEKGLCPNSGLSRAVQRENTVMLLSRGLPAADHIEIHRIRHCIVIPAHFFPVKSCWLGSRQVSNFSASSADPLPIFMDLGRAYLALYPMTLTNHGRQALVRLEQVNRYQVVSFVNYEGEKKLFKREGLLETFNGFLAEISGPDESGSFENFRKNWELGHVEDWWFFGNRRARWIHGKHELSMNWLTEKNVLRSISVDGRDIDRFPLSATGFDAADIPLLGKPYKPRALKLPNETLDIAWGPDMHWQK